jgi:hypothetical protein
MRILLTIIVALSILLPSGCAKELCPGETRYQPFTRIQTSHRTTKKKAKPSMIFVTKSNSRDKRKPPK